MREYTLHLPEYAPMTLDALRNLVERTKDLPGDLPILTMSDAEGNATHHLQQIDVTRLGIFMWPEHKDLEPIYDDDDNVTGYE